MSDPFDRLLCDPDEAMLLDALEQAAKQSRLQSRAWDDLEQIPIQIALLAEGRTQKELEARRGIHRRDFSIAWWSDHQGRKHVRITSGLRHRPDVHLHPSRTDEDERPPWWHICPERAFRVQRVGQEPVWLACCACGEVGTPRQLGWAGNCCGPCHDRGEEGAPLEFAEVSSILWQLGSICALAFTPSSNQLAISSSCRVVNVYHLTRRTKTLLHAREDDEEREGIRPLCYSPDGEELVGADQEYSRLRVWRVNELSSLRASLELGTSARVNGLAFTPDNRYLTSCSEFGDLRIWDRKGWKDVFLTRRVTAHDFAPDGRTLAQGSRGGEVRFLQTGSWETRDRVELFALPDEDVLFLEYTPDGNHLVVVIGNEGYRDPRDQLQLRLWNLPRRCEERYAYIPVVSALAMTPCGRYLAWVVHDDQHSPAAVHFWDLQCWRPAGWLEWNPEDDLRDLAFSPDGQTMATGSTSGVVKLWPWRRLLEG